jgi:hypothetical protein
VRSGCTPTARHLTRDWSFACPGQFDYFDVVTRALAGITRRSARSSTRIGSGNVYYLLGHRGNIRQLTISVSGSSCLNLATGPRQACERNAIISISAIADRAGLLKIGRRPMYLEPSVAASVSKAHITPRGDLSLCCQDARFCPFLATSTPRRSCRSWKNPRPPHVLSVASGLADDEPVVLSLRLCILQALPGLIPSASKAHVSRRYRAAGMLV